MTGVRGDPASTPEWLEPLVQIAAIWRISGKSIRQLFEEAAPDLSSELDFRKLVALRLKSDPGLVNSWQSYSYDKRTSSGPFMDGTKVGVFDGEYRNRRSHATPAKAAADFIYREASSVLRPEWTRQFDRLLRSWDPEADLQQFRRDEHKRLALYRRLLRATKVGEDAELFRVIASDPDPIMAGSALAEHIGVRAQEMAPGSFESWVVGIPVDCLTPFARRRAEEWILYRRVVNGAPVDPQDLLLASDWLQRKVATNDKAGSLLRLLSERGKTRRIRNLAHTSLRPGRLPDDGR